MDNLFSDLNDDEFELLDRFLLDRIDDADTQDQDEGILDISTLDGFFTAMVSGPVMIPPSQWLPAVWGDFEPVWENEKQFEKTLSLMMRHMNGIAVTLMEQPEAFEPVFFEREVEGNLYTIVDEWCEGYQRGVALAADQWVVGGQAMTTLLTPILAFTSATKWRAHDFSDTEVDVIREAITPNVREIHGYWLARRHEHATAIEPVRRSEPRVGRNDPCPCGSGKKYKKCCLQ